MNGYVRGTKYKLIYADPAWSYENEGVKAAIVDRDGTAAYNTATFEEMVAIRIPTDDNCILLMWATFPLYDKCVALMQTWGFVAKGIEAVWAKTYSDCGKLVWNPSSYTASNVEVLLMGTKGKKWKHMFPVCTEIVADLRETGRKPEEAYAYVAEFARRYDLGAPLEMFTRVVHPGFHVLNGDQARDYAHVGPDEPLNAKRVPAPRRGRPDPYALIESQIFVLPTELIETVPLDPTVSIHVLELHAIHHLFLMDWREVARSDDSLIVFRARHESIHLWIHALRAIGFVYKTIMYYVRTGVNLGVGSESARETEDDLPLRDPSWIHESCFYGAAMNRNGRISAIRTRFISQLIHVHPSVWSEASASRAAAEKTRAFAGPNARIRRVKSTWNNVVTIEEMQ